MAPSSRPSVERTHWFQPRREQRPRAAMSAGQLRSERMYRAFAWSEIETSRLAAQEQHGSHALRQLLSDPFHSFDFPSASIRAAQIALGVGMIRELHSLRIPFELLVRHANCH